MNDFENKLRSRKFVPPPAHVRQQVLAASEPTEAPAPMRWIDWLWPSPLAWGAVAAVLLATFVFNLQMSTPRVPAATARALREEPAQPAAYAFFQERRNLDWLKESR